MGVWFGVASQEGRKEGRILGLPCMYNYCKEHAQLALLLLPGLAESAVWIKTGFTRSPSFGIKKLHGSIYKQVGAEFD